MIRILKTIENTPEILQTKGVAARKELEDLYDSGIRILFSKTFDKSIYGHEQVKRRLKDIQHDKCCFCEAKITHISHGDVEHFRPKAGWVQLDEPLNQPGYYWLAYDWGNLFLSCEICNQRFKRNLFPLRYPENRAITHNHSTVNEEPLFIDLSEDDPEHFITFREEIPVAIDGNMRGRLTILGTGINREELNTDRLSFLNMVRDIYDMARDCPLVPAKTKAKALTKIRKYYDASKLDSTEYAAMLRCFFKANPILDL